MPSDVCLENSAAPVAGTELGHGPVMPVADIVAEHVTSCRCIAVSVASKSGWPGHWLHRLAWDLEGTSSLASGVG